MRIARVSVVHVYSIPNQSYLQGKNHSLKNQSNDSLDKDGDNKADRLNSLDKQVLQLPKTKRGNPRQSILVL